MTSKQNPLSPKEVQLLDQTLANIRGHLKLRQSLIKPSFKDFDKVFHILKKRFVPVLVMSLDHNSEDASSI
jgi:hypothetical protein